jgi:hypothetical protein
MPGNSILAEFEGTGASAKTAAQDHLGPGRAASFTMAKTDLRRVQLLKDRFNLAAEEADLPPALLAALASRESRCGNVLDHSGFGDGGNAFGVLQVDRRFHVPAGLPDPTSQSHINQASGILKAFLTETTTRFSSASAARQLQAAIAAYNCGVGHVVSLETADAVTTGHDYSNDVWERAKFYAIGW